ncbi:probable disease resistance protein At4g27220 [Humulus lupulus]|uniref:probable disease resistance protein At4g27220 n=1 Tax=Humulus lupulus TaxID=3486 RepID=UPI002B406DAA|nr:probable disease resistance protein At4g27220 [Humulus lupulus]XP_062077956.1 probable disease resistance protein At4g27220 [Humulus lupulus]
MDYLGKLLEVKEYISSYCNLNKQMQKLKRKLDELSSREVDIISELEYAESFSLKKRKKEVENWLENVKRKKDEVRMMEQAVIQERRLQSRVQLGKCMEELTKEVTELLQSGRFCKGLILDVNDTRGNALLTTKLVGEMFNENMDKIRTCLLKEEVISIGIYGMGGVGKTTLVTHIHNQLLKESCTFGNVYWVTVSKDFSICKLQNDIAKVVSLDLSCEDDEKKRASKLLQALMRRKKFVLILDDLWNHFLFEKVGIPVKANGCKLILTSRSLEVCRRLGCQMNIKVEPLSEEEGWKLFVEKLERRVWFTHELEDVARSVAKECAGLPLGIITMAGSMREVDDICEWRNALEKLKQSKLEQDDMETDVYQVLRVSYRSLSDSNVQRCFLYCALYPEDYKIKRDELIDQFIDEGFIERMTSRRAQFDRGHAILNKLENSCLLEGAVEYFPSEKKCVKMHDLVRDMALQLASSDLGFMVRAGEGLKDLPDEDTWTKNLEKVSLMHNKIPEIPAGAAPNCSRLSTLMLQFNDLKRIPDSFFVHLQGLKVLDLSHTGIESLPSSMSDLDNLTALSLKECDMLQNLPSLARLTALRRLDLANSGIIEVPQGMEMLVNLRYLNLHAPNLKMLPDGILPKLSRLQCLIIYGLSKTLNVKGDEVASLRKLETFAGQFFDVSNLNTYVKSFEGGGPCSYLLQVGLDDPYFAPIESGNFDKQVILKDCRISRSTEGEDSLVLPTDVQYLYFHECHDAISLCDIASLNTASNLNTLVINNCEGVEFVISSSSSSLCAPLQCLESLRLAFLPNLHTLFTREIAESPLVPPTPPPGTFSSLKEFRIYNCSSIKILLAPELLTCLQNLEEIHVEDCGQMVEIIAAPSDDDAEVMMVREELRTITISLPKLKVLQLWNLSELRSICSYGMLVCDSLQLVAVRYCKKLKRIPISMPWLDNQPYPPPSLQIIKAYPKEWWDSLEWEHPKAKDVLGPFCQFSRYL